MLLCIIDTHTSLHILDQSGCEDQQTNLDFLQSRELHNIQRLEVLRASLIYPQCLTTEEFTSHVHDISLADGHESPASASLKVDVWNLEDPQMQNTPSSTQ